MNNRKQILEIVVLCCTFLLVLLWGYTATSKLMAFTEFKRQLIAQHFNPDFTSAMLWLVPLIEIIAAITLLFEKSRLIGLQLSFILMVLFTGYVGLTLMGYFDQRPCSCGGVLQQLGWTAHFWFNLFFLGISILGIVGTTKLSARNELNLIIH